MPPNQRVRQGAGCPRKKRLEEDEEERLWHKIAVRLGKTITEAKAGITVSEFYRWVAFFELEANDFNPLSWHLAAVAFQIALIRYSLIGKKPDFSIKDLVLKFRTANEDEPDTKFMDEEADEFFEDKDEDKPEPKKKKDLAELESQKSMALWFGICGYDPISKKSMYQKRQELIAIARGEKPPDNVPAFPSVRNLPQKVLDATRAFHEKNQCPTKSND
jgi:hypothetical protein